MSRCACSPAVRNADPTELIVAQAQTCRYSCVSYPFSIEYFLPRTEKRKKYCAAYCFFRKKYIPLPHGVMCIPLNIRNRKQ